MKDKKQQVNNLPFDSELEIFGEHKTREQIRAEEKVRRKAEREALKQEMDRLRKEAKADGGVPARRKDMITVSAVLVGIVLLCVLALAINSCRAEESNDWSANTLRGQYVNAEANPDMSGEGPRADVSKAYYTNNGHLCVEMLFSNGTDKVIEIKALDVAAFDYSTDARLGGGYAELEEPVLVEVAGVTAYTFYISPEHLDVPADSVMPELVSFEVKITSSPVSQE